MLLNQSTSWIPTNKYHTFLFIINVLFLNWKVCGKKGQLSHTIMTKMMPKYMPHCDKGFLRQMGWQRDSLEPKILCSNWHKTCSLDRKYPASYLYSPTCLLLYKPHLIPSHKTLPDSLLSQKSNQQPAAACCPLMVTIDSQQTHKLWQSQGRGRRWLGWGAP